MRILDRSSLLAAGFLLIAAPVNADWQRFRGPSGSGISDAKNVPTSWSEEDGIRWKEPLPGPGSSSPIVAKNRVFVTCYSGYGVDRRNPGKLEDLRLHVICVDRETGKTVWNQSIAAKQPEREYDGIGIPNHGYASSTPATDGARVFAYFGRSGVVAYSLDGREVWRAEVDPDPRTHNFGSASSVVLHGDLVIVPASVECESIVAFNKKTGVEEWRAPAEGYGAWWGTPIVVNAGGRDELLVSVPDELWSINPANGKLRWYAETSRERAMCSSVVVHDGKAFVLGRSGGTTAVKIGGKGDVTKSAVAWTSRPGAYVTSPIAYEGHLYWVSDRGGIAYCLDAATGDVKFEERLDGAGSVYASVVVADGKIFAVSRRDGTFVFDAAPKFKTIAHNVIESDPGDFNAGPVPIDGGILLRSDRFLYRIGKE